MMQYVSQRWRVKCAPRSSTRLSLKGLITGRHSLEVTRPFSYNRARRKLGTASNATPNTFALTRSSVGIARIRCSTMITKSAFVSAAPAMLFQLAREVQIATSQSGTGGMDSAGVLSAGRKQSSRARQSLAVDLFASQKRGDAGQNSKTTILK